MVAGKLPTSHPRRMLFGVGNRIQLRRSTHRMDHEKKGVPLRSVHLAHALFRKGVPPPSLAEKTRSARTRSLTFAGTSVALTTTTTRISIIHSSSRINSRQINSPTLLWLCSRELKLRLRFDCGFRSQLLCTLPLAKPFCISHCEAL